MVGRSLVSDDRVAVRLASSPYCRHGYAGSDFKMSFKRAPTTSQSITHLGCLLEPQEPMIRVLRPRDTCPTACPNATVTGTADCKEGDL